MIFRPCFERLRVVPAANIAARAIAEAQANALVKDAKEREAKAKKLADAALDSPKTRKKRCARFS